MHGRRKNHVGCLMRGNGVAPARQNYGRRTLGPWVFGLAIKHASGNTEVRMFHDLRRDESTLRATVLRHIRPGTEIWTGEWRACTNIPRWVSNGQPYVHRTVNHQQNFINPVTGANTQMIER